MARNREIQGEFNFHQRTYGVAMTNAQRSTSRKDIPSEYDYLGGNSRFNLNDAFGYPPVINWRMTRMLYQRSAGAAAAVDLTISRCWQTDPRIRRTDGPEDPQEMNLNQMLDRLGLWREMREADRRALTGTYSAIVIRVRDGMKLDQPVRRVMGGPAAIAEFIPVWQGDLKAETIGEDEKDPETYGKVTMYRYTERDDEGKQRRLIQIHPDRVLIISEDGMMDNRPFLEKAFNACIDLEKTRGGGAEGMMKDARALMHFDIDAEAKLDDGVGGISRASPGQAGRANQSQNEEIADDIGKQMDNMNSRFENMVVTKGMTSKVISTSIRQVQEAAWVAMNNIAAAVNIPVNVLFGNQTGERAASQDQNEWLQSCESRRWFMLRPRINDLVARLVRWGIIDGTSGEWRIEWAPLSETNVTEKVAMADSMVRANAQARQDGMIAATWDEVRAAWGLDPLTDEQVAAERQHIDDLPRPEPAMPGEGGGNQGGSDE